MDCQNIRTAIDTASRFEPMGESAQRHLRSCDGCREYADEMSSFLSLLKSTPRVTAPADFDFRLRARIAEAQAKRRNPFAFLESFWSLSFSWGQTATAMATIALVATLGTFYFVRQAPTPTQIDTTSIAKYTPAPKPEPSNSSVATSQAGTQTAIPQTIAASSSASNNRGRNAVRNASWKRIEQPESATSTQANLAATGPEIMTKDVNGKTLVYRVPVAVYGAQLVVNRAENKLASTQVIF